MLDGSILFVEQVYCDQLLLVSRSQTTPSVPPGGTEGVVWLRETKLLCGYCVCINSWSKNLTVIMTALIVVYATTGTGSCSKASFYW